MGGRGKRSPRARWHIAGGARQRRFQARYRRGLGGTAEKAGSLTAEALADSAKGGRSKEGVTPKIRICCSIWKNCWNQ